MKGKPKRRVRYFNSFPGLVWNVNWYSEDKEITLDIARELFYSGKLIQYKSNTFVAYVLYDEYGYTPK